MFRPRHVPSDFALRLIRSQEYFTWGLRNVLAAGYGKEALWEGSFKEGMGDTFVERLLTDRRAQWTEHVQALLSEITHSAEDWVLAVRDHYDRAVLHGKMRNHIDYALLPVLISGADPVNHRMRRELLALGGLWL